MTSCGCEEEDGCFRGGRVRIMWSAYLASADRGVPGQEAWTMRAYLMFPMHSDIGMGGEKRNDSLVCSRRGGNIDGRCVN